MDKKKIFTSLNNKKGVLLEKEDDNFKVSLWKKETPVETIIDQSEAIDLCEFITSNLNKDLEVDEAENDRKVDFWVNYIEEFKERSSGAKGETGNNDPAKGVV